MQQDPDRGGLVACWTRAEDNDAEGGQLAATFLGADGTVRPRTPLVTIDTRGTAFLATCAPVPNTGGKIAVAIWTQRNRTAQLRVYVWAPSRPNGFEGHATEFHSEFAPDPSDLIPTALRGTVVGTDAWLPLQQQLPAEDASGTGVSSSRYVRLRIGAADLAAGVPRRDVFTDRTVAGTDRAGPQFLGSDGGAWFALQAVNAQYGFVSSRAGEVISIAEPRGNGSEFGWPLATHDDTLAVLWKDALASPDLTNEMSVSWLRPLERLVVGPRLPFRRSDVARPAAFFLRDGLYVVGATSPAVEAQLLGPRADDAGATGGDAGSDAAFQLLGQDAGRLEVNAVLTVYRTRWRADATTPFEVVQRIPRALGQNAVLAADALPMADGQSFGLAWTEFYPADSAGRGPRYSLFMARVPLQ